MCPSFFCDMTGKGKKKNNPLSSEEGTGCLVSFVSGLLFDHATLFDASFFAGEAAEVVEFRATHFTVLVNSDAVDERRLDGEDTLYANVVGHLTHGETLFVSLA